ncbi:basic proline-rich protein-like [Iris pallida]|uniref:Basic proline-rich protein-like n=1 Tax=Iris pallida TaxID=29817 RepID=A0AAX6GS05_IRIPA|nr:basic proline-rich protein-like [Iris pallida]
MAVPSRRCRLLPLPDSPWP